MFVVKLYFAKKYLSGYVYSRRHINGGSPFNYYHKKHFMNSNSTYFITYICLNFLFLNI